MCEVLLYGAILVRKANRKHLDFSLLRKQEGKILLLLPIDE